MTRLDFIRKQKLTAKQWAWVITLAILIIVVRELSSGIYFTVLNILILVYAIFLSFFIYAAYSGDGCPLIRLKVAT